MPLPILTEREWDEGLYDGWFYDGHRIGRPTVKKPNGSTVPAIGDQSPGGQIPKK